MKNDFTYKWSKLFAAKRYSAKDGSIKLTPEEQQELLGDSERLLKDKVIELKNELYENMQKTI